MNRKAFRYFIPLVLILGLVFTAVVSAAPDSEPEACVATQSGVEEKVVWEIRNNNGANYDGGATPEATNSSGTFDVLGQPNNSAELYVKGEDTLSVVATVNNFPAETPDNCEDDLNFRDGVGSNPIKVLREGDANGDDIVENLDFALLGQDWLSEGSTYAADFNEDMQVENLDFALMGQNWLQSGDDYTPPANRAPGDVGDATVEIDETTTTMNADDGFGQREYFRVIANNPSGDGDGSEEILSVVLRILYDESEVSEIVEDVNFEVGEDCVDFIGVSCDGFQTIGNPSSNPAAGTGEIALTVNISNTATTNEEIVVGVVTFFARNNCVAGTDCSTEFANLVAGTGQVGDTNTNYVVNTTTRVPEGRQFTNCASEGNGNACAGGAPGFLAVSLTAQDAGPGLSLILLAIALPLAGISTVAVARKQRN